MASKRSLSQPSITNFFKKANSKGAVPTAQPAEKGLAWSTPSPSVFCYSLADRSPPSPSSPKLKIAAFDLDGTLIRSKTGKPSYMLSKDDWVYTTASVPLVLRELVDQG
jgi:hypothetical protein